MSEKKPPPPPPPPVKPDGKRHEYGEGDGQWVGFTRPPPAPPRPPK